MSKNRIIYVSDYFLSQIIGGGELNDNELILLLKDKGHEVQQIQSHQISLNYLELNKDNKFIISNFINLNPECKSFLKKQCEFIIYEHDHKYLKSRNPASYNNYLAPKSELINQEFYRKAKAVFCQSLFHEKIIKKNLNIKNTISVSGNLWSTESLNIMKDHSTKEKKDRFSVLYSTIGHKNTSETVFYCKKKNYKFDLVSSKEYLEFLSLLSSNNKFIFLPKTPETLSRVVVEARMMGLKVITNKNVGAAYEDWFKFKGPELIEIMRSKRNQIPNQIMEIFNG